MQRRRDSRGNLPLPPEPLHRSASRTGRFAAGVWISLVRLLTRAALALAIALPIGLLLALVRDGRGFAEDFGIACLLVGCFFLLLAPAGSSAAMRAGTIDAWTASFFPKLVPGMMGEYSGTSLAASAVFAITGIALLVVGAILVS